ncbi:hypothetical protein C0993_005146 [Termitomyces sp. T159_Od127]|nr:hypothetical protein C0993_005146 [Termitomyces sp. T159_Od127]
MFAAPSLLATLLLALAVSANPIVVRDSPVKLPLTRRLNVTSVHNLIRHDLARAKHLRARAEALSKGVSPDVFSSDAIIDEPVDNQAVSYIASIGVGSPATTYELIIDTGSSNTWIGAGTSYRPTSTSSKTSNSVSVTYGSGAFAGKTFFMPSDEKMMTVDWLSNRQSIGVASAAIGFAGTDGILGIGPVDLTQGTLSPDFTSLVPTVTDNAFSLGLISGNEIGISFEPTTSIEALNGELSWGGADTSKYTGTIAFAPLTTTTPARLYWGINQSIRYGASTSILSTTAGVVDTGTTLLYIASDAFNRYRSVTGAVLDGTTGLLRITSSQFANLESLFFTINGATFEFTANAQIWPRSLNTALGGSPSSVYLIVADNGGSTGSGLDFINGYAFLERFYTVFDTANKRIGFANTPFTTATTN